MKITISIAADVIRARIQALSALHLFMNDIDRQPFTEDNAPALNQSIVFAFSRALMQVARHVDDFTIDPLNFYSHPQSLLQLEVTFGVKDGATVDSPLIRRALEEYISIAVMGDAFPAGALASTYTVRADNALTEFVSLLTLPSAGSPLRLSRSYP